MADVRGKSPHAEFLAAMTRLESALKRDLEAILKRQARAFAAEQPSSFRDFLYPNEEVVVPERILALRAKRGAITNTMMPPEEEGFE